MWPFSDKPKQTIFDVIDVDLSKYPDDTFIIDKMHSTDEKTYYVKLEQENKILGLFHWLTIIQFNPEGNRNYIFKCDSGEFDKYDFIDFIQKVYEVYGKDDSGYGPYTRDDSEAIDDNSWLGRMWADAKYSIGSAFTYDEEEGFTFTIWT